MEQTRVASPTSPPASPGARSRGFSFRSDRSGGSKGKDREGLAESPRERDRRSNLWNSGTKANPNAALAEAQPGERNVHEASTLSNLRDMQHHDQNGQAIVDPDLSNPTRPRLERPLDTIRSFEKAIDNGYKRRSSYGKQESSEQWDQNNTYASRRSSYFGGEYAPPQARRRASANALAGFDNTNRSGPGGGYYGQQQQQQQQQQRPESAYTNGGRQRHNRMQTDPAYYNANSYQPQPQQQQQQPRPYGQHGYHQSHDTVHTGGSDSTGPWANSTDPSSENSSIERNVGVPNKPQTPMDGFGGYNPPIMEEQGPGGYENGYGQPNGHGQPNGYGNPNGYGQPNGYGHPNGYGAPNGYPNGNGGGRRPIPLGGSGGVPSSNALPSTARPAPEKQQRRSWLKRTFSKG